MRQSSLVNIYRLFLRIPGVNFCMRATLRWLTPKKIALPEGVLFLHQKDSAVSPALALGLYERFECDVFRGLLAPGQCVLDIGANIGLYSVIAAHHVGPTGRVIAFEPEPENRALLEKSLLANSFLWAQTNATALSDRAGTAPLHIAEHNKGQHSLVPPTRVSSTRVPSTRAPLTLDVNTNTFDALAPTLGISRIDLIKIDTEGSEIAVLRGLHATITTYTPTVFVEFTPSYLRRAGHDPMEQLDFFLQKKYSIYDINADEQKVSHVTDPTALIAALGTTRTYYTNLLCIFNKVPVSS